MLRNLFCPAKKSAVWCVCFITVLASALVLTVGSASAQDETFSAVADMPIPNPGSYFFDISFVDPRTDLYLVSNAGNKSLDVYQASTRNYLFSVPGFLGVTFGAGGPDIPHIGPDGVLTVSPTEAWVGDGDSTVKVVDLISRKITDVIPLGGVARSDELAYDSRDGVLIIANPDEGTQTPPGTPFVSLISTKTHKILKRIFFPGVTGLEQPSWSRETDLFYMSIPSLDGTLTNTGVAVIDPRELELKTIFNVGDCGPLGSAIGPDDQLLLGCGGGPQPSGETFIINIRSGQIIKEFFEVGNSDEVWFNPGDNHYYLSANAFGPTPSAYLGVIDAETLQFDGPLVQTAPVSHSVAANPATNQIFVPISSDPADVNCLNGCVRIYVASGSDKNDR